MNTLLIAGTDVGVGKTIVTAALAAYWQTYYAGRSLGIFKPVQAGGEDRDFYPRLFSLSQSADEINPIHFETAIAPPIAAARENRLISLDTVWTTFETLARHRDWVLIEGFGGLGSPLTAESTVADLAWDWRLPCVLVVPIRLGSIGQAVSHVALARQAHIHLKGIILNCLQPMSPEQSDEWAPAELIQTLTGVPVLGTLPYLSEPTQLTKLAQVAATLDLERLLPLSLWQSGTSNNFA
ncbi:MAG: dethiobiotin synthase [Cyanobacteria bacterium J06638_20]